jgi:hypothetical protein
MESFYDDYDARTEASYAPNGNALYAGVLGAWQARHNKQEFRLPNRLQQPETLVCSNPLPLPL